MQHLTPQAWDQFIEDHPKAHILQTRPWGELKSAFGWKPRYVQYQDLGALLLFRQLPLGLSIGYLPRGPMGSGNWAHFWPHLDALCRKERAIFLRVEPDVWEPAQQDFAQNHLPGFISSRQTIQPPRTILIDLQKDDETILMEMKPKTRYNIRLAERKDVVVRQSDDIAGFHQMMLTTGQRDAFGVHSQEYYQRAFDAFTPLGACVLLMAEFNGEPLAGLMAFAHGDTAAYFYGASTNQERNRMPTYLLQWEAMQWAKRKGCTVYDLWGVPDYPEQELEETFLERSEGLWGVYRFKRGFGGQLCRTIGAWDRVYQPLLYKTYQLWADRGQSAPAI
ncbi:MAG: peptidoglycan bridge formation glycyltransferase FemA/FemB family protein [Chloroflexi bacterium]|jgi:lipid II:glycine glycyltransferase (peptidoglycan interpeptide bridge formation enzyme)|nr:peptidoglycan bridge formation glycyltransferase FemA/FemB family protein [Chloroflexota bacterium]